MEKPIRLRKILFGLLLLISLTGCAAGAKPAPVVTPTAAWAHQVAIIFRDRYQRLGGESALGSAVSPEIPRSDGTTCQYLEAVVMCYNPNGDPDRIYLASVGYDVLGIPAKAPSPEIKIYDGFLPAYRDRFLGASHVGKALTEVRLDASKTHLIQYFEKMAFSQDLNDPRAEVKLLPYGTTLFRRDNPKSNLPQGSSIGPAQDTEIPAISSITRLGGFEAIGSPLSKPYPANDARSEQLFENVLAYIPKDNPNTVKLRDLALRVGIIPTAPGVQRYTLKENMVFYPTTKGALGYHVPIYFDQFIANHGGLEISGLPINEPTAVEVNGKLIARQCFQNLCLDYDRSPADGVTVRIAPIGRMYLAKVAEEFKPYVLSAKSVNLKIAKAQAKVTNTQEQTIEVVVTQAQGGKPLRDVEGFILVNLADGQRLAFNLPPTNTSGKTHIIVPPLKNASNAQIIPFIVCLTLPTEQPLCATDSFLIWNLK